MWHKDKLDSTSTGPPLKRSIGKFIGDFSGSFGRPSYPKSRRTWPEMGDLGPGIGGKYSYEVWRQFWMQNTTSQKSQILIKNNAIRYDKKLVEEYQLVLLHGLLHLIGYSHNDQDTLSRIEEKILKKVWNE